MYIYKHNNEYYNGCYTVILIMTADISKKTLYPNIITQYLQFPAANFVIICPHRLRACKETPNRWNRAFTVTLHEIGIRP